MGLVTKYDLYRWCVQDSSRMGAFVHAVHGGEPRVLREDFAGPTGLACAWVSGDASRSAVAVDIDPEPLAHVPATLAMRRGGRLDLRCDDSMTCAAKADVVAALNFAACELHERPALLAYFRAVLGRLNSGGVLVLDIYGGSTACETGRKQATARVPKSDPRFPGMAGKKIGYTWQQVSHDAKTGRVENRISFKFEGDSFADAFVYDWRLWSITELRDLLTESGFGRVELHSTLGGAMDADGRIVPLALDDDDRLDDDYVVYLAAFKARSLPKR